MAAVQEQRSFWKQVLLNVTTALIVMTILGLVSVIFGLD